MAADERRPEPAPAQRHVVLQQRFELALPSADQAGRTFDAARRAGGRALAPVLQRCFDAVSDPSRVVRIDRLEVDLGSFAPGDLEAELAPRLEAMLLAALREVVGDTGPSRPAPGARSTARPVPAAGPGRGAAPVHPPPPGNVGGRSDTPAGSGGRAGASARPGRRDGPDPGEAPDGPLATRAPAGGPHRELELLDHFARTGTLAWWADPGDPEWLDAAAGRLLRLDPEVLAAWLADAGGDAVRRRRLAVHLSTAQVLDLLDASGLGAGGSLASVARALRQGSSGLSTPAEREQRQALLELAALAPTDDTGRRDELLEALAGRRSSTGVAVDGRPRRRRQDLVVGDERLADRSPGDRGSVAPGPGGRRSRRPRIAGPVDTTFSDHHSVHIGNAGLVILAPFLEELFVALELLVDRKLPAGAAADRAASVLHYLATGRPGPPPEHELPLNKVLCGIDPQAVFEPGPPLSGHEIDRCEASLSSVLEAAPDLGIRSNDGLRGSFLLRHGQLGALGGAWHLRVERVTYDLVLERLPWPIGRTVLPWMSAPLRTEW